MARGHILVTKAFRYTKREPTSLTDCYYDNLIGLWFWGTKNDVLINSVHPDRPMPGTKKADIETGEDLKSE